MHSSTNIPNNHPWLEVLQPHQSLFDVPLSEVWQKRYLMLMFVKRDFAANYKQTILGPLWFFIQPLLTSITFFLIFNKVGGISTGKVPQILFYLAGLSCWNYFAETINRTSTVFKDNANLFGKVYFPRLIIPLSIVLSNLLRFGIQFFLFLIVLLYYWWQQPLVIQPNAYMLLTPYLLLLMAGFGIGLGMIISSLTTKYRDLVFLVSFGVQLLMYATPVIYSLSLPTIPTSYRTVLWYNPLAPILETFRFAYLGQGMFSWAMLLYSSCWMVILLTVGILIFNKVEKRFMDTI